MKNPLITLYGKLIIPCFIVLLSAFNAHAQCAVPVSWDGSNSGVAISGTTVTNIGTANSWSNGTYSSMGIRSGGFIQFQAGEQNTYKMIGLNSDPAADNSYCSIDYAWYPYNGGGFQIYENCGNPFGDGTIYSASDVWRIYWNPVNNRIEYYRNNALQYTSTNVPSGTYYPDISLYTTGASFTNVIVQTGPCAGCNATNITWTGASGVTVSGTTITKTGGVSGSWDGGAYSLKPIEKGGYVKFRPGETSSYKMLGLNSDPATDASYCSIDYAWYQQAGGTLCVYESCGNPYCSGTYTTSDEFMVYWNAANNKIEYYKNNVLQYTSTVTPSGQLYVDASIYYTGGSYTNVEVVDNTCASVPTMSTWGLIILTLLTLSVISALALKLEMQQALVPAGVSKVAMPLAFVRSMPLNAALLARVLMYLMPLTVAGFFAVHFLFGSNGALDFTGTLVSALVVGYIVHLAAGWEARMNR